MAMAKFRKLKGHIDLNPFDRGNTQKRDNRDKIMTWGLCIDI